MKTDSRCTGCKYNTPKKHGGFGRGCNGYTMREFDRCPEFVINSMKRIYGNVSMNDIVNLLKVG